MIINLNFEMTSEKSLTPSFDLMVAQRLAFVHFLYGQGVGQSDQPEPLSATAVLSFHDAVESFLLLAAEHLKVNLPTNVNFADYWDRLQLNLPRQAQLPGKNAMIRLNKLRVALKHHGTIPSRMAIEQARGDVTTFFTDATPLVFDVEFDRIDLIDIVARKETIKILRDAQTHADIDDYVAANAGLAVAFEDILDHYSQRHQLGHEDPFGFGPILRKFNGYSRPETFELKPSGVIKHLEAVTNTVAALQRAMGIVALGIDYRRYIEFDILTPQMKIYAGRQITYLMTKAQENLTEQDYQTCKRFVIEAALQAAKADAALNIRTQHLQINNPEPGRSWSLSMRMWTGPAESGSEP